MMVDRWKVPDQITSEDPPKYRVQRKDQNERESRSDHGSYLLPWREGGAVRICLENTQKRWEEYVGGLGPSGEGSEGGRLADLLRISRRAPLSRS